jgi:hypothetical protein
MGGLALGDALALTVVLAEASIYASRQVLP